MCRIFYAIHVPTLDDVDREKLVDAPLNFVDNATDLIRLRSTFGCCERICIAGHGSKRMTAPHGGLWLLWVEAV